MALTLTRGYLALDASGVTAAQVAEGVKGGRLKDLAHEPLPPGAVLPRATGANVADPEAVRAALASVLAKLGRPRVRLVLPDGVARLSLLEPPAGIPPREFVRFRLAPSLPWPASDGVFELLDAGSGRVVGAAVSRATVAQYESAASAAGAEVEQVHLAPLLALAGVRRARDAAHALLGDAAVCLALVSGGALVSLRSRRRDRSPGEAERLEAGLERLHAAANGNGSVPHLVTGGKPGEAGWLAGVVA